MSRIVGYLIFLFSGLLFSPVFAAAQEASFDLSLLSEKGQEVFQVLTKVELFAIGGIGYSGAMSKGEVALDVLLKERNAERTFRHLALSGSMEGGLYALVGLKILKCDCFSETLRAFKDRSVNPERIRWRLKTANGEMIDKVEKGSVRRMEGCIGFTQNRVEVADEIDKDTNDMIAWKIKSGPF